VVNKEKKKKPRPITWAGAQVEEEEGGKYENIPLEGERGGYVNVLVPSESEDGSESGGRRGGEEGEYEEVDEGECQLSGGAVGAEGRREVDGSKHKKRGEDGEYEEVDLGGLQAEGKEGVGRRRKRGEDGYEKVDVGDYPGAKVERSKGRKRGVDGEYEEVDMGEPGKGEGEKRVERSKGRKRGVDSEYEEVDVGEPGKGERSKGRKRGVDGEYEEVDMGETGVVAGDKKKGGSKRKRGADGEYEEVAVGEYQPPGEREGMTEPEEVKDKEGPMREEKKAAEDEEIVRYALVDFKKSDAPARKVKGARKGAGLEHKKAKEDPINIEYATLQHFL
jgi:hypothetical protein